MKALWKVVDESKLPKRWKNTLYLSFRILTASLAGGAFWVFGGYYFLPETEWLICCIGYPAAFAGFFGGILYLYNHKFD